MQTKLVEFWREICLEDILEWDSPSLETRRAREVESLRISNLELQRSKTLLNVLLNPLSPFLRKSGEEPLKNSSLAFTIYTFCEG